MDDHSVCNRYDLSVCVTPPWWPLECTKSPNGNASLAENKAVIASTVRQRSGETCRHMGLPSFFLTKNITDQQWPLSLASCMHVHVYWSHKNYLLHGLHKTKGGSFSNWVVSMRQPILRYRSPRYTHLCTRATVVPPTGRKSLKSLYFTPDIFHLRYATQCVVLCKQKNPSRIYWSWFWYCLELVLDTGSPPVLVYTRQFTVNSQ
jgi:hypothetical protein